MAERYLILCGGACPVDLPQGWRRTERRQLTIGDGPRDVHLNLGDLLRGISTRVPDIAVDLIELASYIYVADQVVTRGGTKTFEYGEKWVRRFRFEIPVRCPDIWNRTDILEALRRLFGFLTDDEHEFRFHKAQNPKPLDGYLTESFGEPTPDEIDEVMLFSGGLDSLCGAVEEVLVGQRCVALVSHRPMNTVFSRQRDLIQRIRQLVTRPDRVPAHVAVTVNKGKALNKDFNQRSRSFLFAAMASIVARAFGRRRIRFYENGVTSLNLPISPSVLGGRASRSTHPQTLHRFGVLFSLLYEVPFQVENPYQWLTKAQMLASLKAHGHAGLCAFTSSCAHPWGRRDSKPHCGLCSQCVDRRLSALAACLSDEDDPPSRYETDVLVGERCGADLTFAERYYGTAMEMGLLDTPIKFVDRYGEINDVPPYLGMRADDAIQHSHALHRCHALGIREAFEGVVKTRSETLVGQNYPANSFLGVTLGRVASTCPTAPPNGQLVGQEVVVDSETFQVRVGSKSCFLGNSREFWVVERLQRARGKFVTLDTLRDDVWDDSSVEKNTIQRTVSNARRKFRKDGFNGVTINGTEQGTYQLVVNPH
jgi:7-cyano-7-deazaguanine synthase in queuosine biosynthesis